MTRLIASPVVVAIVLGCWLAPNVGYAEPTPSRPDRAAEAPSAAVAPTRNPNTSSNTEVSTGKTDATTSNTDGAKTADRVEPGTAVIVLTKDGKSRRGRLVKQDAKTVQLQTPENRTVRIERSEIETIRRDSTAATRRLASAAGVVVRRGGNPYIAAASQIRPDADPDDNVERLLILLPGGPLIVEARITAEGKPFRRLREKLIDEMLQDADTDHDGRPTWNEALANPRFLSSQLRYRARNDEQRAALIKRYDTNGNGLLERIEARRVMGESFGPAFRFYMANTRFGRPNLRAILDRDNDKRLSAEEIAAAPVRLKTQDANDNDLLELNEAGAGMGNNRIYNVQRGGRTLPQQNVSVHLLGPAADLVAVFEALKARYAGEDGRLTADDWPLVPGMVSALDLDKNGQVDSGEVIGLQTIDPHLKLEVAIDSADKTRLRAADANRLPNGLTLKTAQDARSLQVTAPGAVVQLNAAPFTGARFDYGRSAQSLVTRYDRNKNGYLERDELGNNSNTYFTQQFELWDANGDGKVFADEIKASYERRMAPQFSTLVVSLAEHGPSLFAVLDETGDQRLSAREMKNAAERLNSLDKNEDGQLDSQELPLRIDVIFSRGSGIYGTGSGRVVGTFGARRGGQSSGAAKGPKWFVHMDRNGDGDVTLKEFLGTREQFEKLDTNKDGFIERKEAEAATPATSAAKPDAP